MSESKDQITVQASGVEHGSSTNSLAKDAQTGAQSSSSQVEASECPVQPADLVDQKKGAFGYFKTKEFYITVLLGQILAIANTSTGTFTTLLGEEQWAIPAFQTFINYVLLNVIFTPYTMYRYGFKGWLRLVYRDGWKYIILAFCDVEGNYFIVLAYQYTTMLSAQLINFWAIVVVVVISFLFLGVRYHIAQIIGILLCIGGMGVLIGSDHITGTNGGDISQGNQLKGDMFALLAASFYGLTNTGEEYFVSTRPVYEVLGQMSFFGMIINGAQAGIFDRTSFHNAHWNGKVGGYLTGYTLCLSMFYCLAPLLFRLSSAAFFNVSMLTMNFWGVIIGVKVFHYHIHWMYPIAFVLIIIGQLIYFLAQKVLSEARKPWLGANQERGVVGLFTAKRKIVHVIPTAAEFQDQTQTPDDTSKHTPTVNTSAI